MQSDATTASLAASWQRTFDALLGPADDALRDELAGRYAETHRRYHTLQHLGECLAAFDGVVALAERPGEVEAALWFHDAVYDMKAHDNEAQSADWAERALREVGVAPDAARRVHALVMATRHDAAPATADAKLLVDIDLAILGASPARFDEYEAQVRAEYAWVAEKVFRERRRALLDRFLAQPALYATAHFRERLEAQARANLKRSVKRLAG